MMRSSRRCSRDHADPAHADRTGKPPIVYAAARASAPIVDRLLAAGIDVNARYANDLTVLMCGAAGHADERQRRRRRARWCATCSIAARVWTMPTIAAATALMIAAERGHAEVAKLLLAHGADPARRDKQGKTAADLAASGRCAACRAVSHLFAAR